MNIQATQLISFDGYKSKLGHKLDKLIEHGSFQPKECDDLCNLLQKKIKPDRCCGMGMHGEVYKIDDYYVVKVPNKKDAYDHITINEGVVNPFFHELKTYFGETLARIKDYYILKNVSTREKKHTPIGIPFELYKDMPLYDIYSDEKMNGKKSIAFNITIQPSIKTLTKEEIDLISNEIIKLVSTKYNGELRDKVL